MTKSKEKSLGPLLKSKEKLTSARLTTLLSQLNLASSSIFPEVVLDLPPSDQAITEGVTVRYLDKFPGFIPNHSAPLREELERLAKLREWGKKRFRSEVATCCAEEFRYFWGQDVDNLASWQLICADLGLSSVPTSVTQCKKAVRNIHVNIYDYIDCKRAGLNINPVFTNVHEFRSYTIRNDKIFPKDMAKENTLLRKLLEPVFLRNMIKKDSAY